MTIFPIFHWISHIDPELVEEYGEETVRGFMYNGPVQPVIGGMPKWAFATLIWCVVGSIVGIYATSLWKVDGVYNDDEDKFEAESNGTKLSEIEIESLTKNTNHSQSIVNGEVVA